MDDSTLLMSLAGGVSWLLGLAMQVTMLVVALTSVRRASSDASSLLAISAGIGIVSLCVGMGAPILMARAAGGTSEMIRANAIVTLLGSLLHVGAFGLLLAAIVRLAASRSASAREPD